MSHRTREPKSDIINSLIEWLTHESTLEMEQLQRLEREMRKRHGGQWQWVPERAFFALDERNTLIQEAWISDVPAPAIARRFHLSARRVRQICAGLPRQASLLASASAGKGKRF